jgi:uncharacterized protein (DUF58 family)
LSALSLFLLKLACVMAAPMAAAVALRVFPSRKLVWLAIVPAALSAGLLMMEPLFWPLAALDVLLAAVAAIDMATLPSSRQFGVQRTAVRVASLRKRHPVSLTVSNFSRRSFRMEIRDGVPQLLNPEPAEFCVDLPARSRVVLEYVLRAQRRGAFVIDKAHLRVHSRLGLWNRMIVIACGTPIHVYPDLKQLGQYALLARTNRLSLLGVRRMRRIGSDHEFERLRDYAIDDNYKHIEWRSSARRQKLTVKDFQTSQAQRIIFLVDCGRMMTNEAQGLSLLDHSLNAMLMLSFVALRQNDSVGLIVFSDEIHSFIPPRGGMKHMNVLLHSCFDRFPRLVESRYDAAFHHLASHARKRSLVVLITNVIDEVNSSQVERYLTNLVGRHLPLAVVLRDRRLFEAADVERPAGDSLWRAAAAADILAWRHQVLADLNRKGALTLDVFPEEMTAPLVNRYLEIKARHLL